MIRPAARRVAFFISDGTGITAEMLGNSLLTQFEGIEFEHITVPFVDSGDKARQCVERISAEAQRSGTRPIVFTTLIDDTVRGIIRGSNALVLDFFERFMMPLEDELGLKSAHTVGRSHSAMDIKEYQERIAEVDRMLQLLMRANEPTVLEAGDFEFLEKISSITFPLETEGEIDHIDSTRRTVQTAFHRYQVDALSVIPPQRAGYLATNTDLVDETLWCPVNSMNFESTRVPGIHVIGDAASYGAIPKSAFAAQTEARACALSVALGLGGLPLPNPRLINHCYSLIAEERAISITGVYGPKSLGGTVETYGVMESTPEANQQQEYEETMDWFDLLIRSTFN